MYFEKNPCHNFQKYFGTYAHKFAINFDNIRRQEHIRCVGSKTRARVKPVGWVVLGCYVLTVNNWASQIYDRITLFSSCLDVTR